MKLTGAKNLAIASLLVAGLGQGVKADEIIATGGTGSAGASVGGTNVSPLSALSLHVTPPATNVASFANAVAECGVNMNDSNSLQVGWGLFSWGDTDQKQTSGAKSYIVPTFKDDKIVYLPIKTFADMNASEQTKALSGLDEDQRTQVSQGLCLLEKYKHSADAREAVLKNNVGVTTIQGNTAVSVATIQENGATERAKIQSKLATNIAAMNFMDNRLKAEENHAMYGTALLKSVKTVEHNDTLTTTYGYVAGSLPEDSLKVKDGPKPDDEHAKVEVRADEAWGMFKGMMKSSLPTLAQ